MLPPYQPLGMQRIFRIATAASSPHGMRWGGGGGGGQESAAGIQADGVTPRDGPDVAAVCIY